MKKLGLFFILALFMFGNISVCAAKEIKIGYVDVMYVFNEYNKTKDFKAELEQKRETMESHIKLKEQQEEIAQMQKTLPLLGEEEQKEQSGKLREAVSKYREAEREVFATMKKASDEKLQLVLDDIQESIETYAKENGFTLILNKNGVLYGEKNNDLTDIILESINKSYKK